MLTMTVDLPLFLGSVRGRHVMSDEGLCWCQPRVEHGINLSGDPTELTGDPTELTIHRRLMDRPDEQRGAAS